jgi:hypothetical protein
MTPQQSGLMVHRTRHLFIRQQTALIDASREHLACRRRQSRTAEKCDHAGRAVDPERGLSEDLPGLRVHRAAG